MPSAVSLGIARAGTGTLGSDKLGTGTLGSDKLGTGTEGSGTAGTLGRGTGRDGNSTAEGNGRTDFGRRRASATLESMMMDENVRSRRGKRIDMLLQPIVGATQLSQ